MKPLILAGEHGPNFGRLGRTDAAVTFLFRFVGGKLQSPDELAFYVAARTEKHGPGSHWSVYTYHWHDMHRSRKNLSLVELCQPFETVSYGSIRRRTINCSWFGCSIFSVLIQKS